MPPTRVVAHWDNEPSQHRSGPSRADPSDRETTGNIESLESDSDFYSCVNLKTQITPNRERAIYLQPTARAEVYSRRHERRTGHDKRGLPSTKKAASQMIPKFALDDAGCLVSVLLPANESCALQAGSAVRLTRDFELGQGVTLKCGEEGTVIFAGWYARGRTWVEVLLNTIHPGLRYEENKIILEPFVTEDILGCIVLT